MIAPRTYRSPLQRILAGTGLSLPRALAFLSMALVLSGCTGKGCKQVRDIPPEQQLYSYISLAVNVTRMEQKQELIDLTTGPLRKAISNASDETFKKAYLDRKYEFKTFEIIERRDTEPRKAAQIDFRIAYKAWNPGEVPERQPIIETTNRATLSYELGRWAISNVESLGSKFEWDVGLPLEGVSTQGVDPEGPPAEIRTDRQEAEEAEKAGASGADGSNPASGGVSP